MAGLIKRNDTYYLTYRENGKEVRRSLGTGSKRRAQQLKTEYEACGEGTAFEQDTLTVGGLKDLFTVHAVQHYRKPDGTPTSTCTIVEHALRFLDPHIGGECRLAAAIANCGLLNDIVEHGHLPSTDGLVDFSPKHQGEIMIF